MWFDFPVLDYIQSHLRCGFLDFLMPAVTVLGDGGVFWILLAAVLLIFRKTRRFGIAMAAALIVDVILCNAVIKLAVGRVRPYDINTAVQLLTSKPSDSSFPSGHTAASFAGAFALLFSKCRRFWIPAVVLASLIAFSRVYLYIHFPTDVIAGVLVGLIAGLVGGLATARLLKMYDMRRTGKPDTVMSESGR